MFRKSFYMCVYNNCRDEFFSRSTSKIHQTNCKKEIVKIYLICIDRNCGGSQLFGVILDGCNRKSSISFPSLKTMR